MGRRIAVIGGSASGLFAARLLAQGGRSVAVYERSEALSDQPRTLIVTGRLRDYLGTSGEPAVVNEIKRFELFTDGRSATVELQTPDLIVERSAIIAGLADEATEAGATFRFGCRFAGLAPATDGVRVRLDGRGRSADEVEAGVVVGADGTFSRVAHAAGWPRQATVPLVQALVALPADLAPDTTRVWFRPQDTPYFYWLIPESNDRGALGVIGHDGNDIRGRLDAFIAERGLTPLEYQAARIPAYRGWRPVHKRFGGGDVYLVGDAAGQVKVSTVGGLVTGFRGALGVCEAILSGKRSRHLTRLRRELDAHLLIRRVVHRFGQDDYSRLIDLLNDATRRSLGRHTRDEAARVLLSVVRAQPRLLLLAARALLVRDT